MRANPAEDLQTARWWSQSWAWWQSWSTESNAPCCYCVYKPWGPYKKAPSPSVTAS